MPRLLAQIITSLIYLKGVLKVIDKSNKKFGGKFATAPIEFEQLILKSIDYAEKNEIEKTIYLHRHGFYDYSKKYGNPFA